MCGKKAILNSHFINEINKIANLRTKYAEWSENTSVLRSYENHLKFSHSDVMLLHVFVYYTYCSSLKKKENNQTNRRNNGRTENKTISRSM